MWAFFRVRNFPCGLFRCGFFLFIIPADCLMVLTGSFLLLNLDDKQINLLKQTFAMPLIVCSTAHRYALVDWSTLFTLTNIIYYIIWLEIPYECSNYIWSATRMCNELGWVNWTLDWQNDSKDAKWKKFYVFFVVHKFL